MRDLQPTADDESDSEKVENALLIIGTKRQGVFDVITGEAAALNILK